MPVEILNRARVSVHVSETVADTINLGIAQDHDVGPDLQHQLLRNVLSPFPGLLAPAARRDDYRPALDHLQPDLIEAVHFVVLGQDRRALETVVSGWHRPGQGLQDLAAFAAVAREQ